MNIPVEKTKKETARELYVRGLDPVEIARQTGLNHHTIRTWVNRHKWQDQKIDTAITIVKQRANVSSQVSDASARVRQAIADELEKQLESIKNVRLAKSLPVIRERSETISTITRTASTVFGWSAETSTATLDVRSLSAPEPVSTDQADQVESPQASPALLNPSQDSPAN